MKQKKFHYESRRFIQLDTKMKYFRKYIKPKCRQFDLIPFFR